MRFIKFDLVQKFSIYSIIVLFLFGFVLNYAISNNIENMMIERAKATTASYVQHNVGNFLTNQDFDAQDHSKHKTQFEKYYSNIQTNEIIRIKVFDTSGTIIYSDVEELIGKNFTDNQELNDAMEGTVEVDINRDLKKQENIYERQQYHGLMEIYIPIKFKGSDRVAGVIELYQVLDNIDMDIHKVQVIISAIIFMGLFILYFSLVWIAKDASNTIVKQNDELMKAYDQTKELDKMKINFINVMSHELRTPLNVVIGFSELLKQKTFGDLNEKQEHYIDNVIHSGKHLLNLINDIISLMLIDAGKLELIIEKTHVAALIDENLAQIIAKANKTNVKFIKEISPELDYIEVDRQKFGQILFNLLENAVKFSKPEGGTVTITVKKVGNMAQFSVSDTGIGIKKENLNKLFTVFQQLESGMSRKYGGTGLGLAIVKSLVILHGGKIWVESEYGEGTTFIFLVTLKSGEGKK